MVLCGITHYYTWCCVVLPTVTHGVVQDPGRGRDRGRGVGWGH